MSSPSRPSRLRAAGRVAVGVAATASLLLTGALVAAPASAASSPTPVVSDDFSRATANGWGAAATGGVYTSWSTPDGVLTTDGAVARMTLDRGQSAMVSTSATADDTSASAAVRLSSATGSAYYAFVARSQADGSAYRVRLQTTPSGEPRLALSRLNKGAETALAQVKLGGSLLGTAWQNFEMSVTGDDPVRIEARLAAKGAASTPQLVFTDDSAARLTARGGTGLWGYLSGGANGKTQLELDDYRVLDAATPLSATATSTPTTPTPTPTSEVPAPTPTPTPTATATVPATTPASPAPARGATPVGSTSFAIPAGAIFVSSAAQSAGNGTSSSPFRSVQAAVNAANDGATLVLRGGTYNEEVTIPYNKRLTVQSYPREAVWFDGSVPVTNWVASGSRWTSANWNTQFSSNMSNSNARFVNPSYPMAANPDQVFIDGVAQRQVADASQVVAGTFAVDYSSKRLILGSNPAGKSVRASNLSQAFDVQSQGTVLQGFGVVRYGTTFSDGGAVKMQHRDAVLRDLVITDNAMIGLTLGNNNTTVDRVTSKRNGMMGIGGNATYDLVIKNSIVTENNVEHFKDAPVAGGIKITRARNVLIENVDTSDNTGAGLWFDESCWNVTVVRSTSNNNTTTGIQLEISGKALLAGNQTIGGGTGVMIYNTSDVEITNSDFGQGTFNGISLKQDARRPATASTGRDPRMAGGDSAMTWVTKNIKVQNNVFGAPGDNSIRAIDGSTNRAVDTWNVSITGNLFNNRAAGGPKMVAWGNGDNKSFQVYNTPAELAAAKNRGWVNAMVGSAKTVAQMEGDAAAQAGIAVPMSSTVAGLLGVATGTRSLGSAQ